MEHQQNLDKKPIGKLIQDRRPSFIDKRIRISEDFTYYGVTKTQSGNAEIAIALKLILKDGQQLVFQYHELLSPMLFDGVSKITLKTLSTEITIEGKNLDRVIDYLAEHRLMWLKEPDTDWGEVEEGEVKIESIEVAMNLP